MQGVLQAEEEMLLRSLADLVPDDLVSAELSDLDAFCLDAHLLDAPPHPGPHHAATTAKPGTHQTTWYSILSS